MYVEKQTANIFHGVHIRYSTGRCRVIEYVAFIRGRGWCTAHDSPLSAYRRWWWWPRRKGRVRVGCRVLARRGVAEEVLTAGRQSQRGRESRAKLWRLVYARCVPLFRGFIAAVGINEGPCFHGGRVAVQISFYYLPRGIYSTTTDRQGVVVSSMVGGERTAEKEREREDRRTRTAFDTIWTKKRVDALSTLVSFQPRRFSYS